MASFEKRPGPNGRTVWQTRVRKRGWPQQVRTFDRKSGAVAWARELESEIQRGAFVPRAEAERVTLGELLSRYEREITVSHRGEYPERMRIGKMLRDPLARRIDALQTSPLGGTGG